MAEDMKIDLDVIVCKANINPRNGPLLDCVKHVKRPFPSSGLYQGWEEDNKDEDLNFVDLYEFLHDPHNGEEASRARHEESKGRGRRGCEESEQCKEIEEEQWSSQTFIKSQSVDVSMMGMGQSKGLNRDVAKSSVCAITQENRKQLLSQSWWLLADDAWLLVNGKMALREDALEKVSIIKEMYDIDCGIDRLTLLNMGAQ
ncbi:hypothetical protein HOY80DRAFT_1055835 [Tuber brumale]|nr:hypothetical protein HOY80DRAFT_1055835 [Tuber brumale]